MFTNFLKRTAKNPGAYLVDVADNFFLKDFKNKIKKIWLSNQNVEFNFDYFDDETFDVEKIFSTYYKAPFLSPKKVIVINKILKIDYNKLKQLEVLVKKKSQKTFLLFLSDALLSKDILKKKFFKLFNESHFITIKNPTSKDIENFILKYLKKYSVTITDKALILLLDNLDDNYYQAQNELDKLINGIYPNTIINEENVAEISYSQITYSVFDLLDFIFNNDIQSTLKVLKKYFEHVSQGEIIKFYSLLHSQFQKILLFKYYQLKGYSFSEAARSSSLNYYDQKRLKSQKRNISFKKLLQKYEILLSYEPLIKFGGQISFYQMETMIIKIIEA